MQNDEPVRRPDLVHEVGRPEHGQAVLGGKAMYMVDDGDASGGIEADSRLVEEQDRRAMYERARNLHPSPVAAVERSGPFAGTFRHSEPFENRRYPHLGSASGKAMQRSEVK